MSKDRNEFNNRSNSNHPRSISYATRVLGLSLLLEEEIIELQEDDEELVLENDLELWKNYQLKKLFLTLQNIKQVEQ